MGTQMKEMGAHLFCEFNASRRDVLFDLTDVIDKKGGLFPEGDDEGATGVGFIEVKFKILHIVALFRDCIRSRQCKSGVSFPGLTA